VIRPYEGTQPSNDDLRDIHVNGIKWDPNPPYGERGSYRKLTVTLPQDVYERLVRESARRKIAGVRNQMLSALLREALSEYLERLNARVSKKSSDLIYKDSIKTGPT
jgi:transcriptional regulator of met regulon